MENKTDYYDKDIDKRMKKKVYIVVSILLIILALSLPNIGRFIAQTLVIDKQTDIDNLKLTRKFLISDRLAKNLMLHCYEEMQHLSEFLPSLYKDKNPY